MSKWKDTGVTIIQIVHATYYPVGLGDDNKMYEWSQDEGAWLKYWTVKEDVPQS